MPPTRRPKPTHSTNAATAAEAIGPPPPATPQKRSAEAMSSKTAAAAPSAPAKKGKRRKVETPHSKSDPVQGSSQDASLEAQNTDNMSFGLHMPEVINISRRKRTRDVPCMRDDLKDFTRAEPEVPSPPAKSGDVEKLQARIFRLVKELERVKVSNEQEVKKARQDDIFHRIEAEKKYRMLEERLSKQQVAFEKAMDGRRTIEAELRKQNMVHESTIKALQAQLETEKARVSVAMNETGFWRDQSEHTQQLLRTAEDDFEDLSKLEIEERGRREQEAQHLTLPPAYGSLEDEDRLPPTKLADDMRDSGAMELATFKRQIRASFHRRLALAQRQRHHARLRLDPSRQSVADGLFVLELSSTVEEASSNVQQALRHASDTIALSLRTNKAFLAGRKNSKKAASAINGHIGKTEFIAERLARVLLDIIIRTLAALEMRPDISPEMDAVRTKAGLSWSAADYTFLELMRVLFKHAPPASASIESRREKMWLLQFFLTQVMMLRSKFNTMTATNIPSGNGSGARGYGRLCGGRVFEQTLNWLEEQVESERMIAANDEESEPSGPPVFNDRDVMDHARSTLSRPSVPSSTFLAIHSALSRMTPSPLVWSLRLWAARRFLWARDAAQQDDEQFRPDRIPAQLQADMTHVQESNVEADHLGRTRPSATVRVLESPSGPSGLAPSTVTVEGAERAALGQSHEDDDDAYLSSVPSEYFDSEDESDFDPKELEQDASAEAGRARRFDGVSEIAESEQDASPQAGRSRRVDSISEAPGSEDDGDCEEDEEDRELDDQDPHSTDRPSSAHADVEHSLDDSCDEDDSSDEEE